MQKTKSSMSGFAISLLFLDAFRLYHWRNASFVNNFTWEDTDCLHQESRFPTSGTIEEDVRVILPGDTVRIMRGMQAGPDHGMFAPTKCVCYGCLQLFIIHSF